MTTARMPGRQHPYVADEQARAQLDAIAERQQIEADFSITALAAFAVVSLVGIVSFGVGVIVGARG
jgi:hypothetical protein